MISKRSLEIFAITFFSLDQEEVELQLSLTSVEKDFFECSLQIKKLSAKHLHNFSDAAAPDTKDVKLPKTDVPTFDWNLLNWR